MKAEGLEKPRPGKEKGGRRLNKKEEKERDRRKRLG